jgi:hypothetical protein
MKRREFITLLGGAAVAWPLATRAQPSNNKVARIGVLYIGLADAESFKKEQLVSCRAWRIPAETSLAFL